MKILLNLRVPAIKKEFDMFVPDDLRIKVVTTLIAQSIEELSNHQFVSSGNECICSMEKDIVLRPNATLASYGIQNGDHLILM